MASRRRRGGGRLPPPLPQLRARTEDPSSSPAVERSEPRTFRLSSCDAPCSLVVAHLRLFVVSWLHQNRIVQHLARLQAQRRGAVRVRSRAGSGRPPAHCGGAPRWPRSDPGWSRSRRGGEPGLPTSSEAKAEHGARERTIRLSERDVPAGSVMEAAAAAAAPSRRTRRSADGGSRAARRGGAAAWPELGLK